MSRADDYGFTDENKGLASFVTLVKMLHDMRAPRDGAGWATYLTCNSMVPGAGPPPTHPLYLPLGFPSDGPPKPLTAETAKSMERRFRILRAVRKRLEKSMAATGKPDAAVLMKLGSRAFTAIRGLGEDLEVHR